MRELMMVVELNHRQDGRSELKVTDRKSGIVLFTADLNAQESKDLIVGTTVNGGRGVLAQVAEAERLAQVGMVRWNASLNLNRVFDGDTRGNSAKSDVRLNNMIEDNELKPKGHVYHRVDRRNFGLTWIVYGYSETAEQAVADAKAAAAQMERWAINGEWTRPEREEPVQVGDAKYFPSRPELINDEW